MQQNAASVNVPETANLQNLKNLAKCCSDRCLLVITCVCIAIGTILVAIALIVVAITASNATSNGLGKYPGYATEENWSIAQHYSLFPLSLYENYNIPPTKKYIPYPSSRKFATCCTVNRGKMTLCYGGYGISINETILPEKKDIIKSKGRKILQYSALNDYWLWNNRDFSWKHFGYDKHSDYHGGCWDSSFINKVDVGHELVSVTVHFAGGIHYSPHRLFNKTKPDKIQPLSVANSSFPQLSKFAYWQSSSYFFIFGGINAKGESSSEIYRYGEDTKLWMKLGVTNKKNEPSISPRYSALVFRISTNEFYIYGGRTDTQCYSELWKFAGAKWILIYDDKKTFAPINGSETAVNYGAKPLSPGCRFESCVFQKNPNERNNKMFLHSAQQYAIEFYGGKNSLMENKIMTDRWVFPESKSQWFWLSSSPEPNRLPFQHPKYSDLYFPGAIDGGSCWMDNRGNQYIFGGSTDNDKAYRSIVWIKRQ